MSITEEDRLTTSFEHDSLNSPDLPRENNSRRGYWIFGLVGGYTGVLVWYYFYRDQFWDSGEKMCEELSQWGGIGIRRVAEIWAMYFDKLVPIGGCLLLCLSVDKAEGLASSLILSASMQSRNMLRAFFEDNRPVYTASKLKITFPDCNCSFGMPSGHVEGSTTLNCLLIYNILLKSRSVSTTGKALAVVVVLLIQLIMIFSMVYTGRHNLLQSIISSLHSYFWLGIYYATGPQLVASCRSLLTGYSKYSLIKVWTISFLIFAITSLSWLFYFEPNLANFKGHYQIRCFECTRNSNHKMRITMTKIFAYSANTLGLVSAITALGVRSFDKNDRTFFDHLSLQGVGRLFFVFLFCILSFTKFQIRSSSIDEYLTSAAIVFVTNFAFVAGWPKVIDCLNLRFIGDIEY